ncbi:MAG TPA: HEAT repeat domain-containing protein [Methanoregulaceae archaeon]|nr:HEAT repeat domain-containing protein [Methanoregulaceae archaeon]
MVSRNNNPGYRNRIVLILVLCIIALLIGTGFTSNRGLDIAFTLVSLIPVLSAGIWFGRSGVPVAVLLGAGILLTTFITSGSSSPDAMVSAGILLVAGCTSALLAERVRQQRELEVPLIAESRETKKSDIHDIGGTLGIAQYCLLPYLNVKRLKEKKDVRGLIRALTSDDINIQYNATEALGELGDPFAITALIHVLTVDRYSAIRWKAAEALARIGEPAVDPLVSVLDNRNEDVRWKAAIALGDIGDPRAVEPLIHLLGDVDPYVRGRAAYALSLIGQPAVPVLIRVLEQGTAEAKAAAVASLGRINDPRAIAPLIRALGGEDERVRSEALVSLERAETNVLDRFLLILNQAGADESGNQPATDQAGPGTMTASVLREISLSENDLREYLVKALQNTGDPTFKPLIRDILSGFEKEKNN